MSPTTAHATSPPLALRVLLLEDRPADAELVLRALTKAGIAADWRRVQTEEDFVAALESSTDLILADFRLPQFDGLKAVRLVRERGLDVPFIIVTGTLGDELAAECMRHGATDYVLKDRLARLGPAVHRALAEHKLRSDRHEAIEKLRQSEENYRTLFNEAADGIYLSDAEGRLLDANRHGCELFGCGKGTVLGSFITSHIILPEQARAIDAIRQAPLHTRPGTYHFRRCGGSVFSGEATLKVLPDGRLLSIVRDVTEREIADRRIREQADLLNQTRDCIVVTDLAGFITFWNRGAEQLGGWTAAEALGRRFEDLQGPDFLPTLQAVRTAVEQTGAWQQELTMKNKAGQTFTIDLRVTPVCDPTGRPTGRLNIATDITEKKKLQEQFLRAQRMENLGLLAAGIAHDMNNILSPIMMVAPLLRDRIPAAADQKLLAMLEQSARRGAGLVKQILTFAHGKENEPGPVQLKHLARDIATMIEETFPRNIRFTLDIAPGLCPALASPSQIHQVLLNLCVNARDAMPAGGELRLRVANCELDAAAVAGIPDGRAGRFILIEVTDTGCGIPPELQKKIWEPFFTTKETGKGTGLGLSTVRGIISRHRGFGTMTSAVGHGTTFRFYLPAENAAPGGGEGTQAPFALPSQGHGETVLIVDDDAGVISSLGAILSQHGYRILTARNGLAAHELFIVHRETIDLVITDNHMPGLDGPGLIRALRQIRPEVRILLCSGTADQLPPEDPGVEMLLKPFEAGTMLATVQRLLHAR